MPEPRKDAPLPPEPWRQVVWAGLAAAHRERDHLRDLLREALSIPAHGKGCQELRLAGPCDCWIARAREALEKTDG